MAGLLTAFNLSAYAVIDERGIADARSLGIGGADSAVVNDASATIVNPAVLGFMAREAESGVDNNVLSNRTFAWTVLDFGAGATLTGKLGDYLEVLANTDFSRFSSPGLADPETLKSLIELADTLGNVGDKDTIVVNAQAHSLMHIGSFGVGLRTYGQVGGWINELDLKNLGLQVLADDLIAELRTASQNDPGFNPVGYERQILSDESVQTLRDALGGTSANDDVVDYIDFKTKELVDQNGLDANEVSNAVDTLAGIIRETGVSSLLNNQTSITGRGFLAIEIPVSYGYAFSDNFAMGVTARAIFGKVYGTQVWAFNEDNDQILEDSLDSSVDRFNVGLDAAMMYRIPKWQFSLTANNLNRPKFEGYNQNVLINGTNQTLNVPDVILDPQITFGAAWIPVKRFMLATDIELLETDTLLNGYDVQRVSFGSELDLSLLLLRLGTYRNIAEADLGWVLTGGLGFKLWALNVDLGAAVSIDDTVNYDGTDYPRTLRAQAAVSMEF